MTRFFLPRTYGASIPGAGSRRRGSLTYALEEVQKVSPGLVPDLVGIKDRRGSHDGCPTQDSVRDGSGAES